MDVTKYNLVSECVSVQDVLIFLGSSVSIDNGDSENYTCLYHDDAIPSLVVDKQKQYFNCFACPCGGMGSYGFVKYHLTHMNGTKPTPREIILFLAEINPNVMQYEYMFNVKVIPEYDYNSTKKKDFKAKLRGTNALNSLLNRRTSWSDKQVTDYINGIMTNVPDELLVTILNKGSTVKTKNKAFLALLGDEE